MILNPSLTILPGSSVNKELRNMPVVVPSDRDLTEDDIRRIAKDIGINLVVMFQNGTKVNYDAFTERAALIDARSGRFEVRLLGRDADATVADVITVNKAAGIQTKTKN
jgi:hypothetical protein